MLAVTLGSVGLLAQNCWAVLLSFRALQSCEGCNLGALSASYTESVPLRSCDCFCTMTGSVQLLAVVSHLCSCQKQAIQRARIQPGNKLAFLLTSVPDAFLH